MEKFELIASEVFSDEYDAFKERDWKNEPDVAKEIKNMLDSIEEIVYENHEKYKELLFPMDFESFHSQSESIFKTHEKFEKELTPIPFYFTPFKDKIMSYLDCHEAVEYNKKDRFNLFLAFKLRNGSMFEIQGWLDQLLEENEDFLDFLKKNLKRYSFLYSPINLELIEEWLELKLQPKQTAMQTPEVSTNDEEKKGVDDFPIKALSARTLTLALYFFMKDLGIEMSEKGKQSNFVKFLHLVGQIEFTSFHNSNFTDLIKKAPSFGTPKNSIELLTEVKDLFKKVKLDYIVLEIEKAIASEEKAKEEKTMKKK
jgi:hypothetical protein